ncbi:MAG: hypothetical protein WC342_02550 [Methanoregula sp.]|jgi:hypothetical protein
MKSVIAAFLIIALLMLLPVSVLAADDTSANSGAGSATTAEEPSLMVTVSATEPVIGDPVTVSGFANGGNLTAGVQIWVFAGSYVNVTTVPVDANGAYSKTYQTQNLPAATYYVLAESPGNDGVFDLEMINVSGYSSEVINPKTGAEVMTFTGTGSVHDMEAMETLSAALNQAGYDDPYAKISFELVGSRGETSSVETATSVPLQTTTAKSPVSAVIPCAALVFAGAALVLYRQH